MLDHGRRLSSLQDRGSTPRRPRVTTETGRCWTAGCSASSWQSTARHTIFIASVRESYPAGCIIAYNVHQPCGELFPQTWSLTRPRTAVPRRLVRRRRPSKYSISSSETRVIHAHRVFSRKNGAVPAISAAEGTLARKRQIRDFIEFSNKVCATEAHSHSTSY